MHRVAQVIQRVQRTTGHSEGTWPAAGAGLPPVGHQGFADCDSKVLCSVLRTEGS